MFQFGSVRKYRVSLGTKQLEEFLKVKKLLNIRFFLNQNCSIRRIVKMWSAFLALSISTDVGNLIWISIYLFLHSRRSSTASNFHVLWNIQSIQV